MKINAMYQTGRTLYFAFGSNLSRKQMLERCPTHQIIGVASLDGYRIVFPRRSKNRGCAVASVEKSAGDVVFGVVYELEPSDLASLDRSEGYEPGRDPKANRYNRVEVTVALNGRAQPAETYIAVAETDPGLPNAAYLMLIREGARAHGLPGDYIALLDALPFAEG